MTANQTPFPRRSAKHLVELLPFLAVLLFALSKSAFAEWNLVWNDEFNGTAIDTNRWQFDIGNGFWSGGQWIPGWGNNELEYYTARPTNAYVTGGLLHIVARQEMYSGFNYTSARLNTRNLFNMKYGRVDVRARLPQGQGYWPAIWFLPQDSVYGDWAASGEIDLMENKGSNTAVVEGTIHYAGAWPNNVHSGQTYTLPGGQTTNFHSYVLEWTTNAIKWSVDGQSYQTQTNWWSSGGVYPAPFDQPFYLIINLAVGGNYSGNPDGSTVFPGEMQIANVRVYNNTAPLRISATRTNSQINLSWPTNIVCRLQMNSNLASGTDDWVEVFGASSPFVLPLTTISGASFYRLVSP